MVLVRWRTTLFISGFLVIAHLKLLCLFKSGQTFYYFSTTLEFWHLDMNKWLQDSPETYKARCQTLKQYQELISRLVWLPHILLVREHKEDTAEIVCVCFHVYFMEIKGEWKGLVNSKSWAWFLSATVGPLQASLHASPVMFLYEVTFHSTQFCDLFVGLHHNTPVTPYKAITPDIPLHIPR